MSVVLTLPESGRIVLSPQLDTEEETSALVIEADNPPRGVLQRIDGEDEALQCTGSPDATAPGRVTASVTRNATGWTATIGDQNIDCTATDRPGLPGVTSGLRRVEILSLTTGSTQSAGPASRAIAWGLGTGIGLLALLGLIGRKNTGIATAMGIAAVSGWMFIPVDGAYLAEVMRLIGVSADHLPLTFSVFLAAATGATGLSIHLARHRHPVFAALPPLALFFSMAWLWPVIGSMGWLYSAFAGLSLAGLVWVNVHALRIRHYNFAALALAGTMLGSTEVMLRYSHVGSLWNSGDANHGVGSLNTLFDQFERLKSGRHSLYPGTGFPVRIPPRQKETRIACLGASSTGGAFQNDSLDEFYPARLSEMRPEAIEVVNQGVGGWTSLHIRKFLDGHATSLNAEIWTIYLGVNESRPTPLSFADLYDAWQTGDISQPVAVLDSIRLYQGLRLLARGLKPGKGAGVPPDDFRENLLHITDLARKRGVKVLLMSEGLRPNPKALWPYADTMRDVAQSAEHVHFLDTATALHPVGAKAFIDSNHLTDTGHRTVARAMREELDKLGWW
jgi:hypothetical protein